MAMVEAAAASPAGMAIIPRFLALPFFKQASMQIGPSFEPSQPHRLSHRSHIVTLSLGKVPRKSFDLLLNTALPKSQDNND
jgi:hypothetical protein